MDERSNVCPSIGATSDRSQIAILGRVDRRTGWKVVMLGNRHLLGHYAKPRTGTPLTIPRTRIHIRCTTDKDLLGAQLAFRMSDSKLFLNYVWTERSLDLWRIADDVGSEPVHHSFEYRS